jgi:very-short-patch-repair endonuclease
MQGSSIEKMVAVEFIRRGIYFEHSTTTNPLHWPPGTQEFLNGTDPTTQKADFLLPQYKIWLEIQGAYFHTLPGAVQHDAIRFTAIQAAGWRPMFWWEDDIRTRLQDLMNAVPEFYVVNYAKNNDKKLNRTGGQGGNFFEGTAPDTLAGLRKALAGRTKPQQKIQVKRRKKRKKKYVS